MVGALGVALSRRALVAASRTCVHDQSRCLVSVLPGRPSFAPTVPSAGSHSAGSHCLDMKVFRPDALPLPG
jgi:hypothetical protein